MIKIINVSDRTPAPSRVALSTNYPGSKGFPVLIDLRPGEHVLVHNESFEQYGNGVRQTIADYMSLGLLAVYESSTGDVHTYQDRGNNSEYTYDYLIDGPADLALEHALAVAVSLDTVIKLHIASPNVHASPIGNITAAVPTDLATLLTWLTDVQTEYATHIASTAAHNAADTTNTLVPVAATDLPTSVAALRELHNAYHFHKLWYTGGTAQTAAGVLTYTAP